MLTDAQRHCLWHLLLIILLVQYHNSICHRSYLLCQAILQPHESPWKKLYMQADDTSFLHMTRLNQEAFRFLIQYLFNLEDIAHHRHQRRPCMLCPDGYLGLLLFYLGSTMNAKHLCLIFGITPSVCSQMIQLMVLTFLKCKLLEFPWLLVTGHYSLLKQ
jgi:hypothetical protein